jgi:GNAT superfamily N-acetyltransferase
MAPWILPGDELVTEPLRGRPRLGDIVVFQTGERLFAHRITRLSGDRFWARGDHAGGTDGPLAWSRISGRVVGVRRDGRELPLDTPRARLAGWLRSEARQAGRALDARVPGLRRLAESWPARVLGRLRAGEISLVRLEEPGRILAEVLSAGLAPGGLDPLAVERACLAGRCDVLVARSAQDAELGRAVLVPLGWESGADAGLVFSIQVRFGFRGLGIGGRLLDGALARAREFGWRALFARVVAGNERFLGLFRSRGFFEAAPWERPEGLAPEDHWLVRRRKPGRNE